MIQLGGPGGAGKTTSGAALANRLGAHTYEAYAEQNVGLTWTSSVAQPGSMLWRRRRDS